MKHGIKIHNTCTQKFSHVRLHLAARSRPWHLQEQENLWDQGSVHLVNCKNILLLYKFVDLV